MTSSTTKNEITIPASDAQIEILLDASLGMCEVFMIPGEREWIIKNIQKHQKDAIITAAQLNIEDATWTVKFK